MIHKVKNSIQSLKDIITNPLGALKALWEKLISLKNEIMKAGILAILIFLCGYFFAWWTGAVVAFFYVAFKKEIDATQAFGIGTLAGVLVWGVYAGYLNMSNAGIMATKIAKMIPMGALTSANILQITTLIGGLVCGLGALTGAYARELIYDTRLKFGW